MLFFEFFHYFFPFPFDWYWRLIVKLNVVQYFSLECLGGIKIATFEHSTTLSTKPVLNLIPAFPVPRRRLLLVVPMWFRFSFRALAYWGNEAIVSSLYLYGQPIGTIRSGERLNFLLRNESSEVFKRPVIRFFRIRREKAPRHLPLAKVVLDAIATDAHARTGRIWTWAERLVFFDFTFHEIFEGWSKYYVSVPHNSCPCNGLSGGLHVFPFTTSLLRRIGNVSL